MYCCILCPIWRLLGELPALWPRPCLTSSCTVAPHVQEKEMATAGISAAATEAPTVELPEGANSLSLLARGLAAAGITADKFKAVGAA